jgi:hypothetical protein
MSSGPSRLIAALACDRVNQDRWTLDFCLVQALTCGLIGYVASATAQIRDRARRDVLPPGTDHDAPSLMT